MNGHVDVATQSLYETLCSDLKREGVEHPTRLRMAWCFFSTPGFMMIGLHRLASRCRAQRKWRPLERFLLRLEQHLTGCYLSSNAVIGSGLFVPHPTGIVIGRAVIGSGVTIYQNVTIGLRHAKNDPDNDSYPTLGDNVVVGAGAVILGGIRVGNNAVVGANAVVLHDVPDNTSAIGIPARVVP